MDRLVGLSQQMEHESAVGVSDTACTLGECQLVPVFMEVRDELLVALTSILGDFEVALDASQDAFLKCWRTRCRMTEVRNTRAWIFRVGLNSAKDLRRTTWARRYRHSNGEDVHLPSRDSPVEKEVEKEELLQRLRTAIMNLQQDEKEVFLLRQNGELTYEEIASRRGAPLGTVKTQMKRAIHKLRQVFRDS